MEAKKKKEQQKSITIFKLEGSMEAKRSAVAVLEVLAGLRKPSEANELLGVSLARYYVIEARALQGLISAMEERDYRKGKRPETTIAELQKELKRMRVELNRSQALCRMTQKAVGIKSPSSLKVEPKKGKKRKKTVRARKVVDILKRAVSEEGEKEAARVEQHFSA
jgi:hypothetical protein